MLNSKDTGGSAFPVQDADGMSTAQGMTLRDYFAAKAMLPLMGHSGGYWTEANLAAYANTAYAMADAMLTAREL